MLQYFVTIYESYPVCLEMREEMLRCELVHAMFVLSLTFPVNLCIFAESEMQREKYTAIERAPMKIPRSNTNAFEEIHVEIQIVEAGRNGFVSVDRNSRGKHNLRCPHICKQYIIFQERPNKPCTYKFAYKHKHQIYAYTQLPSPL